MGYWNVVEYSGQGEDLNFRVAHHQQFTKLHLKTNFSRACESVYGENEDANWWVRDSSFASFTKDMRLSPIPVNS
jgi:hypothetical protein